MAEGLFFMLWFLEGLLAVEYVATHFWLIFPSDQIFYCLDFKVTNFASINFNKQTL